MTLRLKIDPNNPEKAKIKRAASAIKAGGTVIFPTETVYGLGADPYNDAAVRKVFKLKGRSFSKPLAMIVSSREQIKPLVKNISPTARILMDKFMPGPITLVFKKSKMIPDIVCAGEKTIGIRMPDHRITRALIKACGMPLVATSANRSGKMPATTASSAYKQLKGADVLLDGGRSKIKKASTVVDVSGKKTKILRQGTLKILL